MARTAKLEPLRRWLEAIAALREALEEADQADAFLAESKAAIEDAAKRSDVAKRQAADLEGRRDRLAQQVEGERQQLLAPAVKERDGVLAELAKIKVHIAQDKQAMDEERGRRLSTLRQWGDQERDARIQHEQVLAALRIEADLERGRLVAETDHLKATADEARKDVARAKTEYRAVQDAAAKLAGR